MKTWVLIIAWVVALWSGGCAAAPLEVYGKLPFVERIAISPDGATLAMAVTNGEDRRILLVNADTLKIISGLHAGDVKVRGLQWAGNTTTRRVEPAFSQLPPRKAGRGRRRRRPSRSRPGSGTAPPRPHRLAPGRGASARACGRKRR